MIKMKSVPIIFLIFMFIILTIPAYAADTKKITSVNIQRIYKAKEGEINPDQVSFKPGRSEYTITYQGMYDASDLPIGSYMDYMHEAIINCITACFSYVFTAFLH